MPFFPLSVSSKVFPAGLHVTDTTRRLQMTSSIAKGKAPANNNSYELPWYVSRDFAFSKSLTPSRVEKYRPQVLDDIVGNQETIDRLKVIATDGNCPHIVISVRNQPPPTSCGFNGRLLLGNARYRKDD